MAASAAILSSTKTPMPSHQRISPNVVPPMSSSSRPPPDPPSSSSPRGFSRFRSSLEQSIRTAARLRKSPTPTPDVDDEFATITVKNVKGKEKVTVEEAPKEKDRMNVFRKLESKVTFRRAPREPLAPSQQQRQQKQQQSNDKERQAGFASYMTPSLRQASISSPALHLSSQAIPSPKSQPSVPVSSSSNAAALVSPTRGRTRRASFQPSPSADMIISAPTPLVPKRDRQTPVLPRHRTVKSNPSDLPTSTSPTPKPSRRSSPPSPPDTQTPRSSTELYSPPDTPTPSPRAHVNRSSSSVRPAPARADASQRSTSPTASRTISPIRARSPPHGRVVAPTSNRGLKSSSAIQLPSSTSPSPPPPARRPSIVDTPHRPSLDSPRRASGELKRASPNDARPDSPPPPVRLRATSPTQRSYAQNRHYGISSSSLIAPPSPSSPKTQSPSSHSSQISSSSSPTSASTTFTLLANHVENRERLRKAAGMLCREMARPPPHMAKSEQGVRDWEEVEVRLRPLARLERIWGMSGSGFLGGRSKSGSVNGNGSGSGSGSGGSSGISTVGEERERKVFCEALRDGYVLCQLMNKLRSSSIVRPDAREDGFVKTSNVTRFLAACASYGLTHEDLFQRDDLIVASSESLARVAHTIIALIQFVETPAPSRIKFNNNNNKPGQLERSRQGQGQGQGQGPYMKGSLGRASASTPNLLPPLSTSPIPVARKRYSPPSGLPPLRSDSSEEGHQTPVRAMTPKGKNVNVNPKFNNNDDDNDVFYHDDDGDDDDDVYHRNRVEVKELPPPPTLKPAPPPKSPLRARSPRSNQRPNDSDGGLGAWARKAASPIKSRTDSMAESTRASIGNASFLDAPNDESYALFLARQSVASSAVTDTTITTQVSSILDSHPGGGSYAGNKFETIRTVTTDLTSEVPSMTRAEGNAIADELVMKGGGNGKKGKEMLSAVALFSLSSSSSSSSAVQKLGRERRVSGAHAIDLTRVAEEPDESGSSSREGHEVDRGRRSTERGEDGLRAKGRTMAANPASRERQSNTTNTGADKVHAVHLHKAKWPDDFMDAFQMPIRKSSPSLMNALGLDPEEVPSSSSSNAASSTTTPTTKSGSYAPLSISPPRKLAIVGRSNDGNGGGNGSGTPLTPRRPTHLSRHSVDTAPVLLPKEGILRREASPDGGMPSRIMLRRHSTTKTALPPRTGSSLSRHTPEGHRDSDSESPARTPVPFPRSMSGPGEHSGSPSPRVEATMQGGGASVVNEKPRLVRGRFQSEINESSTRRKQRPDSYDDSGDKPLRTRFESMVNLGGSALGMASASDLMARNSIDGGAVRKTIVVREEGKPPTHFQLGDRIGRGQFGTVYRALNLNTGQMVAVKRIGLEGLKEDEISTLMKEVDLLKSLSHPSIVKYEGMVRDDDTLSIVLEYAENGSLAHTIKAFGKLNERLVASYVVKILEGLHYLHQSDVVHCDLKAANILTTKNGNVKLSDFGVSLNLRAMERQNDVAGTPNWMAPEVIELKGASPKSDIWSLGCTVVELLTGHPPYADITNSMSVMFRIVEDNTPPIPEGCSGLLQEFLEQCFHKDPSMRPSAELLCEHPWLKKNWVALKDLRPQDSIPFLRRVSADMQKVDLTNVLRAQSPTKTETPPPSATSPTPSGRPFEGEFSPREHSFVKTTFSKPVVCRVCLQNVKKTAVLCAKCSLISHSKCASNAPPTCDLRSQLLLYAHYAETGNPMAPYANPLDSHHDIPLVPTALSDIPFASSSTPRSSMDTSPPGPVSNQHSTHSTGSQAAHPPTAFKFMAAFKRSRSNLNADRGNHSSAPSPAPAPSEPDKTPTKEDGRAETPDERPPIVRKRPSVLHRRHKDRPKSYSSTSTGPSISLRSAATATESLTTHNNNNGLHERRQSQFSSTDTDRPTRLSAGGASLYSDEDGRRKTPRVMEVSATESEVTADFVELSTSSTVPGGMPSDPLTADGRRQKRRESKQPGNCTVQ